MIKFVLFLSFLIFTVPKESHGASTVENSPSQGSIRNRIKQLENLPNPIKLNPPSQGLRPRPLPNPRSQNPNTPQAETQKEIGMGDQKTPHAAPPKRPPPSLPIRRGGEVRHNCQKVPPLGPLRILAIDGGGVRGLIPAIVIAQLEKDLGLSITKIFDVFVGNSAGGMLALLITKPGANQDKPAFTAAQIVEKVKSMSAQMFGGIQKSTFDKTKATLTKTKNLLTTGAKYNPEILEKYATETYENTTLSQAIRPVFVATFDLNSETTLILSTPLAKRSKLFDFKMADIARATSAAPFYFPVHPLEFTNNEKGTGLKMQLIDGGVGSNNPTLIGMMDVTKEYCTVPAYEVLSLGTGTAKHHFEKEDMGRKGSPFMMLKPTIKGFMSAQTQNAHEMTKEFLNVLDSFNQKQQNNYTRLQVSLAEEDKKLDDVREQTTENLSKNAQKIINGPQYKEIKERLKKQLCDEGIYRQENMHDKMCPAG
jgi:patatin-like phospholipase/acyl hydrolase